MKEFKTLVQRFEGVGTWTYATIPFDCKKEFGTKGRIRVKGQINNADFESTLMPHGDGQHFIILTKELRDKAKIKVGAIVSIAIQLDTSTGEVDTPEDFKKALQRNKAALDYYEQLAPSHKKEFVQWITEAKREETRVNRVQKAIEKLELGQRLK